MQISSESVNKGQAAGREERRSISWPFAHCIICRRSTQPTGSAAARPHFPWRRLANGSFRLCVRTRTMCFHRRRAGLMGRLLLCKHHIISCRQQSHCRALPPPPAGGAPTAQRVQDARSRVLFDHKCPAWSGMFQIKERQFMTKASSKTCCEDLRPWEEAAQIHHQHQNCQSSRSEFAAI